MEQIKILRLENVSYKYNENTDMEIKAVDNISLEINKGEVLGIVGHTGSGKSTLIQLMNGLLKPSDGKVIFEEYNINDKSIIKKSRLKSKINHKIGIVFQYPENQLFEQSVLKDVSFGPKNMGKSETEQRELATKYLSKLGIDESFYDKSPFELSGGEKRMVAIAGALAMEPEILILDEPTAGLDMCSKEHLLTCLEQLKIEKQMTIVIVTHDLEESIKLIDRIALMEKGSIREIGEAWDIFNRIKDDKESILYFPESMKITAFLQERGMTIKDRAFSFWDISSMADRIVEWIRESPDN